MEISGINDAIFHSFIIFVILMLVHVASTNQKRDHLLEVFGAIREVRVWHSAQRAIMLLERDELWMNKNWVLPGDNN